MPTKTASCVAPSGIFFTKSNVRPSTIPVLLVPHQHPLQLVMVAVRERVLHLTALLAPGHMQLPCGGHHRRGGGGTPQREGEAQDCNTLTIVLIILVLSRGGIRAPITQKRLR